MTGKTAPAGAAVDSLIRLTRNDQTSLRFDSSWVAHKTLTAWVKVGSI